ncbi:MaoC family dehydratase [Methylocystis sp. L43]|uniref:MaoC family dehydratase n=1 Tax=unclassified Methylocystis TaxID=2625913 RepID=UPI0018C29552|nr:MULTISPECIES: MaoC family dehydratase [unclassified Methylocystis]MBG0796692.1 MaoC family dehydratase [Methylocystis sp. L43]MBG0804589.1 MaoC family dehydratase [Methylocystis sp. H15]
MSKSKINVGNFFEDFKIGQVIRHAAPRTVTVGEVALYTALYLPRFAVQSSTAFAQAIGYERAPIDDLLVFHLVLGKTVPDVSLNAIANLGYADFKFLIPVYPGDTLSATSEVIGLKENSNKETGVVYVRTTGANQRGETVLSYARWVMVKKRDRDAHVGPEIVPDLPKSVAPSELGKAAPAINVGAYDKALAGSRYFWGDYDQGEKIDHIDGMTVEEAEHQLATRLYQNNSKVHFNQYYEAQGRFGKRIIYGGHVISLARALSFNGLENVFHISAVNGGRHVNPLFAGGTVFAWSEVLEKAEIPGRQDIGALRLRLVATKDKPCADFPLYGADGKPDPAVLLDLDYWGVLPR